MSRTAGSIARLLLCAGLVMAPAACRIAPKVCSVCQRGECTNLTFSIHLADGSTIETCCPRCGLHALEHERRAAVAIAVKDFETAAGLDARAAFFVDGSDVAPCSSMHAGSAPKDERGCCVRPVYDRCLPSVLAFGSKSRAEAFRRQHGGTVKTFDDLRATGRTGVPSGA